MSHYFITQQQEWIYEVSELYKLLENSFSSFLVENILHYNRFLNKLGLVG